ncbi:translocation/assembly module TamB domain-containing protein [Negadavirga shengliensis]|uniref:Translocation/assembly module TamB domain-containing protein n=1 Tax=Negadavirga shengliensis TaxID=1389218 RepID=A0ABV9SUX9_9BACT
MEKKAKVTEILLKGLKVLFRIMLFWIILLVTVAALLQVPRIQTYLAGFLTEKISKSTGFKTSIKGVNIRWWDALSLRDVEIYDLEDSLMVDLEEVYIDFSIKGLLDKEQPGLDEINLKEGNVRLLTHGEEGDLNITVFFNRMGDFFRQRSGKKTKRGTYFNISHISFEKTSLDIIDYTLPDMDLKFDYGNLKFRELIANASDFRIRRDTIAFDLKYLRGSEATSGMVFQQLKTDFTYSSTGMEFKDLYLKSNQTEIKDYLRFSYDDVRALRDFNNQVNIDAHLEETVLDIRDLGYFTSNMPDIDDRIYLSGEISGKVKSLYSEQLLLRFGERSALFGKFSIDGLPHVDETFFSLSLVNSSLNTRDLRPYVKTPETQRELDKLRDIRFDSDFTGYLNRFTANGDFRTGIGRLKGNINYRLDRNIPSYNGRIETFNLDIGTLMGDRELFQKISLNGNVKGTGLTVESALLELDANISQIGINKYNFRNIQTKATYGKDLFRGQLAVKDPNLVMSIDGTLDLRDNKDSANLVMKLDTAFLQNIHLTENDIFLSGSFDLDTKGVHWDNIEGGARFRDVLVSYEGRDLFLDHFLFQSLFTEQSRVISLNSDMLVAGISGNFTVEPLIDDLRQLWQEYYAILTDDYNGHTHKKTLQQEDYYIDLYLDLRDPNPIINLFEPSLFISKQTKVEGAFYQTEKNTVFNFFSSIDTVYFNGNYFLDNNVDMNTSKIKDSNEVLASFYVFSKELQLNSGFNFHNLALETIWDKSNLTMDLSLDQLLTESYLKVNADVNLTKGSTSVVFAPSEIKLLENYWEFDQENKIVFTKDEIFIENLKLFHQNQYISASGKVNSNPEDKLNIHIHELNLNFLNSFGIREYEGTANGLISLTEAAQKAGSEGFLEITDIHINNFLIGDISGRVSYDKGRAMVDVNNFRDGKKIISLTGALGAMEEEMDLKAAFEKANLSVIEPFFSDYISQIDGTVSGNMQLKGTIARPVIEGTGKLEGGTFRFNYLNTVYQVNGNVIFEPNDISFRGLELRDTNNNRASLRGGITHDNFSNFILDIHSELANFQVMNTSLADNELFYGTAFASGTVEVFGAANNLDINANATSQPNTRIFIPIGSTQGQLQEDFIRIINVRDTTQKIDLEETVDKLAINNLRMNLNLDLTPDAYMEIQIDPRTGENIQGRGRGVLNLNIDTQGNFNMTGTYEIVDALYNFSLYNVINKRFLIEPGGRISWYGDPYEGVMNIRAIYEENVSLISLQSAPSGSELENTQLKRRYPVKVIMDLDGPLMSPDISFAFDFSEFPEGGELQTTISAFQNRIANDEQEKNRQVFSLIMLRRFSPEGQFSGAGIGFSNLSQLVSSQLNSLIAQVDQNLEIDFDLTSLDETALETFQLRVAYTFLDGRLRVTRDGGFTDLQGNADFNTIAGDWQAEYLLTEDGRYRVRVYNRNNFNTFTALNINNRAPNTYGVSVSQNLLFSSVRELFQNFTRRRSTLLPLIDSDEYLRYDFDIDLEEVAPELFKPDPVEAPSPIRVLDQPKKPEEGEK